jgi:inorganic pyrophosphatase
MNFDEAITAHSQWRIRLQGFIAGTSQENLDPKIVAVDNKCVLGQWIHGEAKQYAQMPEYVLLIKEHANFHQRAANVLRLVEAGKREEAKAEVGAGEFFKASIQTINAIRHLRKKVEKG